MGRLVGPGRPQSAEWRRVIVVSTGKPRSQTPTSHGAPSVPGLALIRSRANQNRFAIRDEAAPLTSVLSCWQTSTSVHSLWTRLGGNQNRLPENQDSTPFSGAIGGPERTYSRRPALLHPG